MLSQLISSFITYFVVSTTVFQVGNHTQHVLSQHTFSLDNRYANKSVSDVFKDNILLTASYMNGITDTAKPIDWQKVDAPFHYTFTLDPHETFAFHDGVLPQYTGKIVKTTNAHFDAQEGFKSDGYLVGDGVCHFASLINWTAKDAGLDVIAPTNHDFANIPEVPKAYGVAIYSTPLDKQTSAAQNLYITNNKDKTIAFEFDYKNDKLAVSVVEEN